MGKRKIEWSIRFSAKYNWLDPRPVTLLETETLARSQGDWLPSRTSLVADGEVCGHVYCVPVSQQYAGGNLVGPVRSRWIGNGVPRIGRGYAAALEVPGEAGLRLKRTTPVKIELGLIVADELRVIQENVYRSADGCIMQTDRIGSVVT